MIVTALLRIDNFQAKNDKIGELLSGGGREIRGLRICQTVSLVFILKH